MPEAVSLDHVIKLYGHVCHCLTLICDTWCDLDAGVNDRVPGINDLGADVNDRDAGVNDRGSGVNDTLVDSLITSTARLADGLQRYAYNSRQNVSSSVYRSLTHSLHVLYRYTVLVVRVSMVPGVNECAVFSSGSVRFLCRQMAVSAWRGLLETVSLSYSTFSALSQLSLLPSSSISPPNKYGSFIRVCDQILQHLDLKRLKTTLVSDGTDGCGKAGSLLVLSKQLCHQLCPLIEQLLEHTRCVTSCYHSISRAAAGLDQPSNFNNLLSHEQQLAHAWNQLCQCCEGGSLGVQTRLFNKSNHYSDHDQQQQEQKGLWEKFLCTVQQLRDAVELTETACNTSLLRCMLCVFDAVGECSAAGYGSDAPETILTQLCELAGECSADEPQLATVFSCLSVLSELSTLHDMRNVLTRHSTPYGADKNRQLKTSIQKHCPLHDYSLLATDLNRVLSGQSLLQEPVLGAISDGLLRLEIDGRHVAGDRLLEFSGVTQPGTCCSCLILQQGEIVTLRKWLVTDLRSALDRIVDPAAFVHVAFSDSLTVTSKVAHLAPSVGRLDELLIAQFSGVLSLGRRVVNFLETLVEPPVYTSLSQFILPDTVLQLTADLREVVGRSSRLSSVVAKGHGVSNVCGTNEYPRPTSAQVVGCMKAIVTYTKRIAVQLSTVCAELTDNCDEMDAVNTLLKQPLATPTVSIPGKTAVAPSRLLVAADTPGYGDRSQQVGQDRTRGVSFARTPYRKARRSPISPLMTNIRV